MIFIVYTYSYKGLSEKALAIVIAKANQIRSVKCSVVIVPAQ